MRVRDPDKPKGVRFTIYLLENQLAELDRQADEMGVTRSKYIEMKCLPKKMQVLEKKAGNFGRGQKKTRSE